MSLAPQIGDPPEEGRYVVFVPCEALQVREWCEPHIATWAGGHWHFRYPVWGWIGPLPVVHSDTLGAMHRNKELTWDEVFSDLRKTEHGSFVADRPAQEYDL